VDQDQSWRHGRRGKGHIVGKSKGSQRTEGVTGRGSRQSKSDWRDPLHGVKVVGEGDPIWRRSQAGLAFLQRAVVGWCPGIVYGIGGAERALCCCRMCDVFEMRPIILLVVVVPPLSNTGGSKPGDEKDGAFDGFPFNILQANEEQETVPSDLWGAYGVTL